MRRRGGACWRPRTKCRSPLAAASNAGWTIPAGRTWPCGSGPTWRLNGPRWMLPPACPALAAFSMADRYACYGSNAMSWRMRRRCPASSRGPAIRRSARLPTRRTRRNGARSWPSCGRAPVTRRCNALPRRCPMAPGSLIWGCCGGGSGGRLSLVWRPPRSSRCWTGWAGPVAALRWRLCWSARAGIPPGSPWAWTSPTASGLGIELAPFGPDCWETLLADPALSVPAASRGALAAWPGETAAAPDWPETLRVRASGIVRRLNHVKLTLLAGRPAPPKIYLYYGLLP